MAEIVTRLAAHGLNLISVQSTGGAFCSDDRSMAVGGNACGGGNASHH